MALTNGNTQYRFIGDTEGDWLGSWFTRGFNQRTGRPYGKWHGGAYLTDLTALGSCLVACMMAA